MNEIEEYYDQRLTDLGIDHVSWEGVGYGDEGQRTIGLRPKSDGKYRVQTLIGNAERTEYHSLEVNDALGGKGIMAIRVDVFREAPVHSEIYITVAGDPDPFRVTKRY
jgi:hypothetical protein